MYPVSVVVEASPVTVGIWTCRKDQPRDPKDILDNLRKKPTSLIRTSVATGYHGSAVPVGSNESSAGGETWAKGEAKAERPSVDTAKNARFENLILKESFGEVSEWVRCAVRCIDCSAEQGQGESER